MRSHDTDWTSLIAGLTFLAIGLSYLVGSLTDLHVDARWVLALLLIGLGAAGLAGSFLHALSDRKAHPPS